MRPPQPHVPKRIRNRANVNSAAYAHRAGAAFCSTSTFARALFFFFWGGGGGTRTHARLSARIVNRIYGQRIASTNCSAVSKTNWSSSPTAPRHRDQRRISRAVGGLSSANSAQHFVAQARLHITARPNNNQWQHAQKQQRAWPTPSVWGGTDSRPHRPAPIARRQVQLSNAKAQLYDHTAPAACASQITRTLILPRRALAVRRER